MHLALLVSEMQADNSTAFHMWKESSFNCQQVLEVGIVFLGSAYS